MCPGYTTDTNHVQASERIRTPTKDKLGAYRGWFAGDRDIRAGGRENRRRTGADVELVGVDAGQAAVYGQVVNLTESGGRVRCGNCSAQIMGFSDQQAHENGECKTSHHERETLTAIANGNHGRVP